MPTRVLNEVTRIPAAPASVAAEHFERRLQHETDCWDVHDAFARGAPGFVLLDVRSRAAFEEGHVPGAVHVAHVDLDAARLASFPADTLFVVYCTGPRCNAAQKAGLRLARLGRPVKEMLGGFEGWIRQGYAVERGA